MADRSVRVGDSRGVSQSIGFVLVFGIIVSSVGIVYVTGFEDLRQTRNAEQATNAERAFDVLKANLEDMSKRGAPSRATEIKLADAELGAGEPVRMTINVSQRSNASNFSLFAFRYEPLLYDTGDNVIVYSNGAVLRTSPGGTAVVQDPEYVLADDRVLMPLVHTYRGGGGGGVSGSATVLVRTELRASALHISQTDPAREYEVNVTMETPRAEAWARYYREQGMDCPTVTDDELQCELTGSDSVERAQVSRIYVEMLFE